MQQHIAQMQAERMMGPRERSALARQRETKGFIETYYNNAKVKDAPSKNIVSDEALK